MKRFIAAAATAAFLMAFAGTADAVTVYLTTNQGNNTAADRTNFHSAGPDEEDLLGNTGSVSLTAGGHTLNLWVDPQGDTLTLLGLRIGVTNGQFVAYDGGSTMGPNLKPSDDTAIGGGVFLTVSNIDFSAGCSAFGILPAPGQPQGRCVGGAFGTVPDQSAAMLMGTVDLTINPGGSIVVVVGPLSNFKVEATGGQEFFFASQELAASEAAAPEPAAMALLGLGLAGLAFVRRRS